MKPSSSDGSSHDPYKPRQWAKQLHDARTQWIVMALHRRAGKTTAVRELRAKPYVYGTVFVPHDAEGTEQGNEQTRLKTMQDLWPGVPFVVLPRLPVDDGIAKGKLMFARLWIDEERCAAWLDAISQYRQEWDENRGMFKETPYHDWTSHFADVHRYAAMAENDMRNEVFKPYTPPPLPAESPYEGSYQEGGKSPFKNVGMMG